MRTSLESPTHRFSFTVFAGLVARAVVEPSRDIEGLPHPVLPQMPASTEFGEGEDPVGMNIFIVAQVEIVPSPFSPACPDALCRGCSLRGANGEG